LKHKLTYYQWMGRRLYSKVSPLPIIHRWFYNSETRLCDSLGNRTPKVNIFADSTICFRLLMRWHHTLS